MIRSNALRNICRIIGSKTRITNDQLNQLQDVDEMRLEKNEDGTWVIFDLELKQYVGEILTII